jgi:hypothetical protein
VGGARAPIPLSQGAGSEEGGLGCSEKMDFGQCVVRTGATAPLAETLPWGWGGWGSQSGAKRPSSERTRREGMRCLLSRLPGKEGRARREGKGRGGKRGWGAAFRGRRRTGCASRGHSGRGAARAARALEWRGAGVGTPRGVMRCAGRVLGDPEHWAGAARGGRRSRRQGWRCRGPGRSLFGKGGVRGVARPGKSMAWGEAGNWVSS